MYYAEINISEPIKLSSNEIQGGAVTNRHELNTATDKNVRRM